MINLNLFQLVDMAFDSMAQKLAQNISSNIETVVRNRAAREDSEIAERCSRQRDVMRGVHSDSNVYPLRSPSQLSRKELEKRVEHLMDELDYKPKDKTLFIA